ncbi:putative 2-aminoethylphosphonate ABC transporter permease subunit [Christensenella intestinihominis]|uniref:putative 2-aminoethylphosphonate ABC transporter permease subunit n=1 Tax=Christensenella intestinihominis TaxID=1851429 RepID=UPI00082AC712|nr:putative 2-aminoethylphosphonate ABC transporter permease subunit [Christensenella intestinihominis]
MKKKLFRNPGQWMLMVALTFFFVVIMILPLGSLFSKAFLNSTGDFVGLANYAKYFTTPALSVSVGNTIDISLWTAVLSTILGFAFAYALRRSRLRCKTFLKYMALLPIFMPTVVHGLALVYLFGNQGLVTGLGWDIGLYGRTGIILSEIVYTFPQAFLMFDIALGFADGRLYEAADSMGCGPAKGFFRITLPEVKYTLISSLFVCFTLAFTDFGAPKVLGGSFNVLATDIYKQVAGQFNMNMGAVIGTLLLIPAVLNFAVDRITSKKTDGTVSARAIPLRIKKSRGRDAALGVVCWFIVGFFGLMVAVLVMGAFVKYYPYDMGFTLQNFVFNQSTGGFASFLNSLSMSFFSALFGTVFVFVYAYLIEKGRGMGPLKKAGRVLSALPIALPGMVIGLAFIFFFNAKNNPLNFVYGTIGILVLANMLHFYAVPFVTASGALRKLDGEYENVSESMKVPWYKTFFKVSVPLSLPAILEMFMFYFVNSMVTVSAVVFLYSANFKVASIAITHMEESGDFAQAAAMSLLILAVNVGVRAVYELAVRRLKKPKRKEAKESEL